MAWVPLMFLATVSTKLFRLCFVENFGGFTILCPQFRLFLSFMNNSDLCLVNVDTTYLYSSVKFHVFKYETPLFDYHNNNFPNRTK